MKSTSVLVILWASHASMAAEHDKTSPRPFNLSKKFVGETHLRGVVERDSLLATDEDSLVATDEALEDSLSDTPANWLEAHNNRRRSYHEDFGVSFVPLEWSDGLEDKATAWAKSLVENCKNLSPSGIDYGVNSQGETGSHRVWSAERTLVNWENKLGKGYPANNAMTQALWRPTKYVGCGSAYRPAVWTSRTNKEIACNYSVCFYAKPGNCGMGQSRGDNWEAVTYADESGCLPKCPPELNDSPEGCK